LFAWLLLQFFFPFKTDKIVLEIKGKERAKDWKTYVVWITFVTTILLWVTESLTGINSNVVALIPLGVFTALGIFEKEDIKEINWSVLWLVAGGFALGTCLEKTGLATTLINAIDFNAMNVALVFIVSGFIFFFLSNFISNSATANLLIPILIVVGKALIGNPAFENIGGIAALIPFIAMCASLAMMLPISTPPNALAASTGMVPTKDMAKVGIIIGVVGFILGYFMLTRIFPFEAMESVQQTATATL
jgi:sodium-dependent dicarboxylate transporter 2/3/5